MAKRDDLISTLINGAVLVEAQAGRESRRATDADRANPFDSMRTKEILTEIDLIIGLNGKTVRLLKFLVRQNADLQRQINQLAQLAQSTQSTPASQSTQSTQSK
jgi:hypothetical protein